MPKKKTDDTTLESSEFATIKLWKLFICSFGAANWHNPSLSMSLSNSTPKILFLTPQKLG